MTQTTEKRSRLSRFGRWVAELVLVFVGVYAAFWLNNYQQHRQDAGRRDQILASLEQQLREGIESGKINRAKDEREATEFQRALNAGDAAAATFCFHDRLQPN
jgi:cytoskeletal protein RodZ